MTREECTRAVLAAKRAKGLKWEEIAKAVGRNVAWSTAALQGQAAMDEGEATRAAGILGLGRDEIQVLQECPMRGSLDKTVPSDPLIYRFHEIMQVYGTTIKEIVHEQLGDGIMSAIDFTLNVEQVPDPKGPRVRVTMEGKFLPYKKW